jgi:hypothetical protein
MLTSFSSEWKRPSQQTMGAQFEAMHAYDANNYIKKKIITTANVHLNVEKMHCII